MDVSHFTVSLAAERITQQTGHRVLPRHITDLFYAGRLPECQVVGCRRFIPATMLPQIVEELRKAGRLPQDDAAMAEAVTK